MAFGDDYNRKRTDYFKKVLEIFDIKWQEGKYKYSMDLPMLEGIKQTLYSFLDKYWVKLQSLMRAQADYEKLVVTEEHFAKYLEKKHAVMQRGPIPVPVEAIADSDDEDELEGEEERRQ